MGNFKKLAQKRLFLPVFSMILVMLINVVSVSYTHLTLPTKLEV